MLIQFTLSMPNVGSWNGRWSGEQNIYAKVRTVGKKATAEALIAKRSFYYNFGDGWGASISVQRIDSSQARKIRKVSRGFCGYEWMIDSIVADGVIYGPTRPKPEPVVTITAKPDVSPKTVKVLCDAALLVLDKDCPF